jgi:hypothetical protein
MVLWLDVVGNLSGIAATKVSASGILILFIGSDLPIIFGPSIAQNINTQLHPVS